MINHPDELNGETTTLSEILYNLKFGKINEFTAIRLLIERLIMLEVEKSTWDENS